VGNCLDIRIEDNLINCSGLSNARGEYRVRDKDDCSVDLKVEIENVPNGAYTIVVAGIARGTLNVVAGQGQIEFDDSPENPGEVLITFDPFGEIDVVRNATGQLYFSQSGGCTIP
jgi:hypothetical protein